MVLLQGRQSAGATVSMTFERWSKLTMALTCGTQQINVLQAGANPVAIAAASSTATFLSTPNGSGTIQAGDMITVDADYSGQTGYLGAGTSAAYLTTAIGSDLNWVRRMTLNVGRVTVVTAAGLQLAEPLLAGVPTDGMQAQSISALQDREGGTFFPGVVGTVLHAGRAGRCLVLLLPTPADDVRPCGARRAILGTALAPSSEWTLRRSSCR